MKKKIWLTSLEKSEESVQQVMSSLRKYGLDVDGHFWGDDLDKMAWVEPRKELLNTDVKMWIILASSDSLNEPTVRYGLSMLSIGVQSIRGLNFPIFILEQGSKPISSETLPTPLTACSIFQAGSATYGAKIVAALHKTVSEEHPPYRLDVYGIPQIGQWFEVGPRDGVWKGVIFGTSQSGISLQAVGPAGQLPEKTTLNYPQQGLKLEVGGSAYDGWAVQNDLDEKTSYFVKVDNHPDAIMFCPFTQDDETEAYIIKLK